MNLNKYAADKLKELRQKKGLTQLELAEELGITQQQIARYENNRRQFKQDMLFKFANYFNVSINDFFPDSKNNPFRNEHDEELEKIAMELGGQILYIDKDEPLTKEDVLKFTSDLLEVVDEQNKKKEEDK